MLKIALNNGVFTHIPDIQIPTEGKNGQTLMVENRQLPDAEQIKLTGKLATIAEAERHNKSLPYTDARRQKKGQSRKLYLNSDADYSIVKTHITKIEGLESVNIHNGFQLFAMHQKDGFLSELLRDSFWVVVGVRRPNEYDEAEENEGEILGESQPLESPIV